MQPTLLILAAGIGSRYGGIKQLDQFGPNGETIIDYSLYDAIRAGFGKVVFIIREELRKDFEEIFLPKLAGKIDVDFAIQALDSYVPEELGAIQRTKPWGTGHAMLCAWEQTDTPFAVINADDFYGQEAFRILADFLVNNTDDAMHALVGYEVQNTLSDYGSVSRGVCDLNADETLSSVIERTKIYRQSAGDDVGQIVFEEADGLTVLAPDTPVSMNFWGFKPAVFPLVEEQFADYARANYNAPKAEFYIPTIMTNLIQRNQGQCQVFRSQSEWFGVTYPDDKPLVQASFKRLHEEGKYPERLW
ncbi:nucleotidyltransferase family protein [Larkinella humicola]|uniref:NTP transferase domain-containing protein n=1 Tax=Larkinella humicola TaxID=2607654 RepID=A0A5N1JI26_9BACT|nr:sugar phosphate nucleotidyltransferase [Larkinella humicola]KAA9355088.1 NTP transferase domain-containing protein [Larkinella humicola]